MRAAEPRATPTNVGKMMLSHVSFRPTASLARLCYVSYPFTPRSRINLLTVHFSRQTMPMLFFFARGGKEGIFVDQVRSSEVWRAALNFLARSLSPSSVSPRLTHPSGLWICASSLQDGEGLRGELFLGGADRHLQGVLQAHGR